MGDDHIRPVGPDHPDDFLAKHDIRNELPVRATQKDCLACAITPRSLKLLFFSNFRELFGVDARISRSLVPGCHLDNDDVFAFGSQLRDRARRRKFGVVGVSDDDHIRRKDLFIFLLRHARLNSLTDDSLANAAFYPHSTVKSSFRFQIIGHLVQRLIRLLARDKAFTASDPRLQFV